MSLEHSFGTAIGGAAESAGADFRPRVLLGGIGMLEGWEARDGTEYYAIQGPRDVNRYLDGAQVGALGYAITPSQENGITELDSGMTAGDPIEQHNWLLSTGERLNPRTRREVNRVLYELTR
ncbi:hypothetical protein [Microbacterium imperiale]|uniref:Uncharacterized protein n=1 Tax=Microbacterium imperiale TaxID=33884 RepID=A0A9W6M2R3_9MICO|nr:hypothetical protein [Microbacterium imperiale]MBP2419466.1 hypothetical protein [Microbacterium imperiale]MDS0198664.1 hypothetical protein [Microbacterium imperiale]BFE39809.1 hypothetical protein GCM10017544_07650 [Microbacterium imperiale]GLJ79216.1 hypothetical protein GCM10017586_08980 [Microbacterium imperiale]